MLLIPLNQNAPHSSMAQIRTNFDTIAAEMSALDARLDVIEATWATINELAEQMSKTKVTEDEKGKDDNE